MKIHAISDTHSQHEHFEDFLSGDLLIHAGDASIHGRYGEILDFFRWLGMLDFKHKIYVPGNHDKYIETNTFSAKKLAKEYGINLLINETIKIGSLKIHGYPYVPKCQDGGAFQEERGSEALKERLSRIPNDLNILVSHCPPQKILDKSNRINYGCELLSEKIFKLNPDVFICGHIHDAYGFQQINGIDFYNVSSFRGWSQKGDITEIVSRWPTV